MATPGPLVLQHKPVESMNLLDLGRVCQKKNQITFNRMLNFLIDINNKISVGDTN